MPHIDPHAPPPFDPLAVMLPRATRFRRWLVWGSLAVAGVVFASVVAYGFLHSNTGLSTGKTEGYVAANQKPPQHPDMGAFPTDYSQIKPVRTAAVPSPTAAPAAVSTGPRTSGQPTEAEKARVSNVFFPQAAATSTPSGGSATGLPPPVQGELPPLYGNVPLPQDAQGGLAIQKNAFLNNAGGARDYVAKSIQRPLSPYEIKAGTVIPAALVTGINSDLPGEIIAQVTENVFDTATGHFLLVPQGSRLVGKYDSLVSYGQNRALVVWARLILPNGDSIDLEGMPGSDQAGVAGLQDQTNHHRWEFAGALGVSTLLSLGPSIAQAVAENGHSGSDTNVFTGPASGLGSSSSQVGENLLNRELNRPNTITVRPGWPLNVLINRDLVMRSYTNG